MHPLHGARVAALGGVRVLDLSSGIAGPLAAMYLADFGADVVKVESPEGDPARALPGFAVWNRNKRGIVIDGESVQGRQRLDEFLAGADVCVTNAGDSNEISQHHPGMVVLSVPPYAPGVTPWAGGGESHGLLSALGGAARRQSSFDGGPIDLVYPLALYVQGQWGAATAIAALIELERSGFGQEVTVSGVHAIALACIGQMNVIPSQQSLPTNVGAGGRHPCYTTYQCQDDEWLFMAALIAKFQRNAFKVLGVGDIFADERIGGVPMRMLLPENRGWVRQLLADAFRTRPRDAWLELLEQGDCPAGPIWERDEWLDHPQICANGLRAELDGVVMPGLAIVPKKTPGEIRSAAPLLGQHDRDVHPWEPRTPPTGSPKTSTRGPLQGFRVLDLGTILAGPYGGALLAELGADVVKVEPPAGDPFRETGFIYNRGQRGLGIDLSSTAARAAFYTLVRTVDAVIDNSRQGVLPRLQIDYPRLAEIKPDIVTLSIAGFGERGPLAHKPAFDPVLQAMSGMMAAQGGDSDPVLFTIPVNDIAAATLAVIGVCLGLFHRLRTGVGQQVNTSLLGCSAMMQAGELVRVEGRPPPTRGGHDFAGPSALDHFYQTRDGWLRLQAPDVQALKTAGLLRECATSLTDDDTRKTLEEAIGALSLEDALAALEGAGVPAVAARQPGDLPEDPVFRDLEIFRTQLMRDGTPFYTTHRYAHFSRTQECAVLDAPGIGEHSREVLAEAGVSAADIDALIASGAVVEGQPFKVVAIQNYR